MECPYCKIGYSSKHYCIQRYFTTGQHSKMHVENMEEQIRQLSEQNRKLMNIVDILNKRFTRMEEDFSRIQKNYSARIFKKIHKCMVDIVPNQTFTQFVKDLFENTTGEEVLTRFFENIQISDSFTEEIQFQLRKNSGSPSPETTGISSLPVLCFEERKNVVWVWDHLEENTDDFTWRKINEGDVYHCVKNYRFKVMQSFKEWKETQNPHSDKFSQLSNNYNSKRWSTFYNRTEINKCKILQGKMVRAIYQAMPKTNLEKNGTEGGVFR